MRAVMTAVMTAIHGEYAVLVWVSWEYRLSREPRQYNPPWVERFEDRGDVVAFAIGHRPVYRIDMCIVALR